MQHPKKTKYVSLCIYLSVIGVVWRLQPSAARSPRPAIQPDDKEFIANCYPLDGGPKTEFFVNEKGIKIASYTWPVEHPKAVVLLVHGLQSHGRFQFLRHLLPWEPDVISIGSSQPLHPACKGKRVVRFCVYEGSWVNKLNDKGISVYAMDLQGFGLSEGWQGRRSNANRLDDFAKDVASKLALISTEIQGQRNMQLNSSASEAFTFFLPPLYVAGYSLGGFAVLRAVELLAERKHPLLKPRGIGASPDVKLEGVAAFAPMLSIDRLKSVPINRLALTFGQLLSRFAPHCPVSKTTPNGRATWIDEHKIEVSENGRGKGLHARRCIDIWFLDPLIPYGMRVPARMCMETVLGVPRALEQSTVLPSHLRFFFVHSRKDRICEFKGTQQFFESLTSVQDKQFLQLEEGSHYLTFDERNEILANQLASWILKEPIQAEQLSVPMGASGKPATQFVHQQQAPDIGLS